MSNLPPGYSGFDGTFTEALRCRICRLVWVEEAQYHYNARDTDPLCPRENAETTPLPWLWWHLAVLWLLNRACFHRNVSTIYPRTQWLGKLYDYLTWPVELPYYSKASRRARKAYDFKVMYGGKRLLPYDDAAAEALEIFNKEDR